MISLFGLDPATYVPSALHQPDRTFPQTNCYVDLWIELLHAQGIPPESAMAFACTVDFEDDQWTFFKPPPDELLRLHGIDVHEMQLYRPAVDHVLEQLRAGKGVTLEVDSWYLPDTADSAYRCAHVKTSIAIEALDPVQNRMRYFHGAGYYELSGDDYLGLFRLGKDFSEDVLPPYAEVVNFKAAPRLEGAELRREAAASLRRQLSHKPKRNPWTTFGARLVEDMRELLDGPETSYHAYAFATVRQCGAAFDMTRSFVQWLHTDSPHAVTAAGALARQVTGAKTLLFKLARRKAFDPAPAIAELARDWITAMDSLDRLTLSVEGKAA